ncbi:hypothetical protein B0A48_02114 [Cryoendolithus antarcticus]|uniref:Aminopeptidase n=1 Tax=Cryoendolithus antarcticus TaxID=1507870 RepID=A0A1V8TN22_9PEZI|nr:hypothetical protein B0A48_02114 [Cryoendolithus antarcticus]
MDLNHSTTSTSSIPGRDASNTSTVAAPSKQDRMTIRSLGYSPGALSPGPLNSILDIPNLSVGQVIFPTSPSQPETSTARKGATIIFPRGTEGLKAITPCHAGYAVFNGNGCLTGTPQIEDWGFTNTPIGFTNSLSLGGVFDGIWDWILDLQESLGITGRLQSRLYGTPVVGETADWLINSANLRASRLSASEIRQACTAAKTAGQGGVVEEGQCGGGAGMTCHQFSGGTGTSSRLIKGDRPSGPEGSEKEYMLGCLVQTNYGGLVDLTIGGVPIGRLLMKDGASASKAFAATPASRQPEPQPAGRADDGSILVLLVTDAPLSPTQLNRLARHATAGLACVGGNGIGRNFSGDIFLALSTAPHPGEQLIGKTGGVEDAIMGRFNASQTYQIEVIKNESIDTFLAAAGEATEEAILNSLVGGRDGVVCMDGETKIDGLPVEKVKALLERYLVKV